MGVYNGCELPEELLYDVERDVWVRVEADGSVTVGMTDPAQASCGKIVFIRFRAPGRELRRGQSIATIESAKWVGPVPSPVTGRVVATNKSAFEKDILIANKDPYGEGWISRIEPSRLDEERSSLLTGPEAFEAYRDKITAKKISCYRCAG